MKFIQDKILVILGPTSSGKSNLAVKIAKKFEGEVISADSRQVYKGLDIGTGKITKNEMRGVPHHLLNVASPKTIFTVAKYKELAEKAIEKISTRGKLPIICGGTGFYIQAVIDDIMLPEVPPNVNLRKKLKDKTVVELFELLKKLDPARAQNIDLKNPHRLVRAIEIATKLGSVPRLDVVGRPSGSKYDVLQIGIKTDDKILKKKISIRLFARISRGMVAEVKNLHSNGLSWKRMEELGLEYRYLARFLQDKISKEEMIRQLSAEIWRYSRRQKTWFKRDKRIVWIEASDLKNMEREINRFL